MKKIKSKIISHAIFFIFGVLVGLVSCKSSFSIFESNNVLLIEGDVYGIKFKGQKTHKNKVPNPHTNNSDEDLKSVFINKYNSVAVNENISSSAQLIGNQISLKIYQPSWRSTWYTDIDFKIVRKSNSKASIEIYFDFVYGPEGRIDLEKNQGIMAKNQLNDLISKSLSSLFETPDA